MDYAIIFDLDGVLIDSEYYYLKQNKRFIEEHGKTVKEEDLFRVVGTPIQTTYKMLYEYFENEMMFEEMVAEYNEFCEVLSADYRLLINDGVIETLSYFKNKCIPLALASSSDVRSIYRVMNQCDIGKYFDVILSGDQFTMSKPNPEIYLTAAKMLKIEPNRCYVVEDSVYGIEAGKRAGMTVFAIKERFHHDQSKADYHIDKITEIIQYIDNN